MAKVELTEAPSAKIIAIAARTHTVTDSLGRSITIGKPKPLDNLDFAKAIGAEGQNIGYQMECGHLKFVRAIDGEPVVTPGSESELRVLYARLADEGNEAVRQGIVEHLIAETQATEAEVKNS